MENSVQEPIVEREGITEVENPAELLRHQDGTFRVTSPYGPIFQVTCRKGRNMRVREIGNSGNTSLSDATRHDRFDGSDDEPTVRKWRIEKIA